MATIPSQTTAEHPNVQGHLRLARGGFSLDAKFRFPSHGITALFGPSGAGKSTLLRAIAGLEQDASGHLRIDRDEWQTGEHRLAAHRRSVGYVFQEAGLFQHLNVRDNLLFGYRRVTTGERRLHPDDLVQRLGLGDLLERMPQGLSGGERQRVAIGRALLTSPRLLLLDEPLAALDQASKNEILPYLASLHAMLPIPMLYVSHSQEEVARLADYLLLMRDGRITDQSPVAQLVNQLNSPLTSADDSFSLLHCRLDAQLEDYQLSRLRIGDSRLLVPAIADARPGQPVRLRIQARDVSLCLRKPTDSSILNILPVQLRDVADVVRGQRLLLLENRDLTLLARISEMSFQQLHLQSGQSLFAQVKSVALLDH